MAEFKEGDVVVLKSGSMRMCVEGIADDGKIQTVWCNEGVIGRDMFAPVLLNAWEFREDSGHRGGGDRGGPRGGDRGGPRGGGGKPYGGDREGGGKRYGGRDDRGDRGDRDDRPRKTGWDGKPRDKKFYRKDD